jgi:hypothetical protein
MHPHELHTHGDDRLLPHSGWNGTLEPANWAKMASLGAEYAVQHLRGQESGLRQCAFR